MSRAKRRDRHGRGLRGPLAPPEVPISLTRSEKFDDLVREEVQRIVAPWSERLAGVEFAVEDVPRPDPDETRVPLSATREAGGTTRVVVFRRPVESRAGSSGQGERELVRLIHELVVEEVAALLGVPPEEVEP
ncbi:metallopeptidase family protein [Actinocorallia populi]|uniref:metallopeptidase family protein n=1 Tax=Actinocorallia populi TaxID=2079200 RepID=UPI000D08A177|nr:metallopeptidase family protein [Actinocorallia populi]